MSLPFHDGFQTRYRFIAVAKTESQRFFDGRPRLVVADFSIDDKTQKFFGDYVIGIETTEHLKKSAASRAKDMQSLDMSPKHLRSFNYCVVYRPAIDCTFINSSKCHHFSEQDQRKTFSLKPFFKLTVAPVCACYENCYQEDCNRADSLNPSGRAGMGFYPNQNRFGKLETFEHCVSLPRIPIPIERVAA
jgi:hypothetical protein